MQRIATKEDPYIPRASLRIKSSPLFPSNNDVNSHIDQWSVPFEILISSATTRLSHSVTKSLFRERWNVADTVYDAYCSTRLFKERFLRPKISLLDSSIVLNPRLTRRAFKLADISDVLQQGCGFTVDLGLGIVALLAQCREQARVRRHEARIRGTQGGYLLLLRVDHALLVRQRRRHLLLFAT